MKPRYYKSLGKAKRLLGNPLTAKPAKFREGDIGVYVGYATKASFRVVANKLSHAVGIFSRNTGRFQVPVKSERVSTR